MTSPLSLLDALGSMGGSNAAAGAMAGAPGGTGGAGMGSMLSMLAPPPSQASVFAQALSGGISAMRGTPDPVQAIVQQGQQQQNAIAQMMMKISEQQRLANQWGINQQRLQSGEDRRFAAEQAKEQRQIQNDRQVQAKMFLDINEKSLEKATTPEARQTLAQQRGVYMQNLTGQPTPPEVISSWTVPPEESKDRREAIAQAFVVAGDDPEKLQMVVSKFGLAPDAATYYSTMVKNDAFLEANKIPSAAVLKNRQNEFDLTEAKLRDSAIPFEQRHDPQWYSKMDAMAIKAYPGLNWKDLDDAQRGRVWDMVSLQDQSKKIAEHQAAANIDAQKALQVFGAKQSILQAQKQALPLGETGKIMVNTDGKIADPAWTIPEASQKGYFQVAAKELDGVTKSAMALKQLEVIRDSVKALENAKLTADTPGVLGYLGDQARIASSRYTDPKQRALLVNLEANKAELINILRQTGDNARAAQLLIPAIQSISPQSGAAGIRGVMANLESALRAGNAATRTPGLLNNIPRVFPVPQGIPGVGQNMDQNGMIPGTRED